MLVSVLTLNVHWQRAPIVMHRGSFHNFAATQHVPLHFPVPGDRVAVLRTGLLVHIQHIRDAVLRPRRWGRDGAAAGGASSGAAPGRGAHSTGAATPAGSLSVGAAPGERWQGGGVSRPDSMNELASSAEVVKSENKNASNVVLLNGALKCAAENESGPRDMDVDTPRTTAGADQSMHDSDPEGGSKPRPQPPALDQKDLNVNGATAQMNAKDEQQQQNDIEGAESKGQADRGGSGALDSARGQQMGSGEAGSHGGAAALPPVPPPTVKQESWLEEINEVDSVAKTLNPVELMTVAAVAYIPADIPEAVQRCALPSLSLCQDC